MFMGAAYPAASRQRNLVRCNEASRKRAFAKEVSVFLVYVPVEWKLTAGECWFWMVSFSLLATGLKYMKR